MCGRYASTRGPAELAADFDAVDETSDQLREPDYNVAPTKRVFAVVSRDADGAAGRAVRVVRWGLVPHWAKDRSIASKMINARAETVRKKPAFRSSLAKRRCLLPADGWFEWRRDGREKQPFFMTPSDGKGLAMAGIWSVWHDPNAEEGTPPLVTAAVLTTDAVGRLTDIHNRMPLLLPPESWSRWLDTEHVGSDDVSPLLAPASNDLVDGLELRPVSSEVNSVRNNGPSLVVPAAMAPETVRDLDADGDQLSLRGRTP